MVEERKRRRVQIEVGKKILHDRCAKLHEAGYSNAQIAKELNVRESTVRIALAH